MQSVTFIELLTHLIIFLLNLIEVTLNAVYKVTEQ